MKIERIDDKTLKCFISNEELAEHELDYKDFVTRTEKAKEIVHEIMEQAKEEVGFNPPKFAFDLQIMMIPEQGMVLTFSDKDPVELKDSDRLIKYLQEMKNTLMGMKDGASAVLDKPAQESTASKEKETVKAKKLPAGADKPQDAIFVFDSITKIMEFAQILPGTLRVASALYKVEDSYYLLLNKGGAAYEKYSRACIQALEFGALYSAQPKDLLFLEEHGECLIRENAIKKLK